MHYKKTYGDSLTEVLANAACASDAACLAVIGVFIKIGAHNEAYQPIVNSKHSQRILLCIHLTTTFPF